MAGRLGRQAHRHRKGTAIYLGPLASGSHCLSSTPQGERRQQNSSHPAAGAMFIQYSKPLQKHPVAASETQTEQARARVRERHGDIEAPSEGELAAGEIER